MIVRPIRQIVQHMEETTGHLSDASEIEVIICLT